MKKIIILVSVLLFFGCSDPQLEPTFNPNYKGIVMADGEYFRVPHGANYYTMKSTRLDSINFYKSNGFVCNRNDVIWGESAIYQMLNTIHKQDIFDRSVISMWKKEKIGCAHPLNEKEYRFYRSKEIEDRRETIAANEAYRNATIATMNAYLLNRSSRKINVNLQGSINHNIRYGY